jgi:hypothetical protein
LIFRTAYAPSDSLSTRKEQRKFLSVGTESIRVFSKGVGMPAEAEADLEVPDLESLVHVLGLRGS